MAVQVVKIIRPTTVTISTGWGPAGAATLPLASDPLDTEQHDEDVTYGVKASGGAVLPLGFSGNTAFPEKMGAITKFEVVTRAKRTDGAGDNTIALEVRLLGSTVTGSSQTLALNVYGEFKAELARPGGGDWTESDLRQATFEWRLVPGSSSSTIHETSLYVRVTYIPADLVIPQHVHTATHRLLQQTLDDHRHTLRVPLWLALKLELLDPFNVSHDELLRSASHLASLLGSDFGRDPNQLFLRWERQLVDLVSVTVHYLEREATLEFQDLEKFNVTYFCSERTVGATFDDYPGMSQIDVGGGKLTNERAHHAYILQENNVLLSGATEGSAFARVSPAVAKRNHLGLLCEDLTTQSVPNSHFQSGLTGWTSVLNGGTITAITTLPAFPKALTANSIQVVRPNNLADTYFHRTFAVLSADAIRRIPITHANFGTFASSNSSWALQRSTDSFWWNDSAPGWQSGFVWNVLTQSWDATNTLMRATRECSKRITVSANENWTIRIGMNGSLLPAPGGTTNFFSVESTIGRLRYSSVPAPSSGAFTSGADVVKTVLDVDTADPVRQLHWAGHGTIELSMVAEQDVDDLELGAKHVLALAQYGSSSKAFDAVIYEKPTSGAARFTFEHWRDVGGTSTLDGRATKEIDIVRGTTYHVTARHIGTDLELGLAARTLRIRVNGQNGTDASAAVMHSATEKHTELWFGSAPAATGFKRAMNYIYDDRFEPRVITDEETRTT